jgi:hypothetical protein
MPRSSGSWTERKAGTDSLRAAASSYNPDDLERIGANSRVIFSKEMNAR